MTEILNRGTSTEVTGGRGKVKEKVGNIDIMVLKYKNMKIIRTQVVMNRTGDIKTQSTSDI